MKRVVPTIDFRDQGKSRSANEPIAAERLVGQLFVQLIQENDAYLQAMRQIRIDVTAAIRAKLAEVRRTRRWADKQVWEARELLMAMYAFQHGKKDRLWRWVEERCGSEPSPLLVAQLKYMVPPIVGDTDVGSVIVPARSCAEGHRIRVERDRRKRSNDERTQQLYASLGKGRDRDYMQSLAGFEVPPKQMLKRVLPGIVYSLGEDLPPKALRRKAQKLIKDDNRLLRQTRKLGKNKHGDPEEKISSLDALGNEIQDEPFLAAFSRMEDERRQSKMERAGLTPREWQIVEFQRDLYSRAEMAYMLGTTVENVNTHASNAARKLRKVQNF